MKKISIIGFDGNKIKEIEIPSVFQTNIRNDIIHKVFEATKKRQPYGSYVLAGKEASASSKQRHRRHKYKTLYGLGVSRVPRKVLSRRGDRFNWKGGFISGTVGGMAAHPPKINKRKAKINDKEKKLALKSAIAATASKEILEKKYPKLKISFDPPLIIDSSILEKKSKEIISFLSKLLEIKIKRNKKIRAGKGKRRGRKYIKRNKILLVTSTKENAKKLKNFGIDIINVKELNISHLAPGGTPGRIAIWTEKALGELK